MTDSGTAGQGQGHEHRTSADTVDAIAVAEAWLAEDPDPDTRAELQALRTLGAVGDTEHVDVVRRLLDDEEQAVRRQAARSLTQLARRLDLEIDLD